MTSTDELRLDDQLCFALYSATNEVIRAYRPLLRRIGLTYPQYLALMALWERDGQALSELAEQLHLPVNGVLPVVDRLQAAGFIERRRSRRDRRVVIVELTNAGADLERDAFRAQRQVVCQTGLDSAALDGLRNELTALRQRLTGAEERDSWDPASSKPQPNAESLG